MNNLLDNSDMSKKSITKNNDKITEKKEYDDNILSQFNINKFSSNKKNVEKFEDNVNINKSYLIKFLNYYLENLEYDKDKYFDKNEVISNLLTQLPDKMNRYEFYDYCADYFITKSSHHLLYWDLASKILVHKLHKKTTPTIKTVVETLYNNKDVHGERSSLVSEEYYNIIQKHHIRIQRKLNMERDYLFDYFGIKTLERSYLLKIHEKGEEKIIERPQHLLMRVSLGIHGYNLDAAFETYDLMSNRFFTHATPTLFNSGTPRPQMSSCFLAGIGDSIESIFETIGELANISKWAGGIGIHLSGIRARGSLIRKTNGKSDGIIPLAIVLNWTARYINQGGKRNGSIACYLEPWHADIFEFVELRSIKGNESNRARDLFLALWIPDLFYKRLENDEMWSLMCPDECPNLNKTHGKEFEDLYLKYESEGKFRKQVKTSTLWKHIMTQHVETGFPYILNKDNANLKSNQKNLGTIRSSNLCVAGSTKIITDKGVYEIGSLVNKKMNIWNGFEFSNVTIKQTGSNQILHKIEFSNGESLYCTPYHKFYIQEGYSNSKQKEIIADDLQENFKIIKCNFPVLNNENIMKNPYTHGLFCADGTYETEGELKQCSFKKSEESNYCKRHLFFENDENKNENYNLITDKTKCNGICGIKRPKLYLYEDKRNLLNHIIGRKDCKVREIDNRIEISLPLDIEEKYFVPYNDSLDVKLRWLEGYVDGDGCITNNNGTQTIQVSSINKDFLKDVKTLLNTIGIDGKINIMHNESKRNLPDGRGGQKIYNCKTSFRMCISTNELQKIVKLGFSPKRLEINVRECNRDAKQFIKVKRIIKNITKQDTYCFTEEKRHLGVFNGIVTGQCAEIVEYSDENETAVCNLSSICLPRFLEKDANNKYQFNYEKLMNVVRVNVRNLNEVINKNFYPTTKTKKSNFKHRPIAIGVQGLADLYNKLKFPFESMEASLINKNIFETMYYAALDESKEISKLYGPYDSFKGSPLSEGELQFHMWGLKVDDLNMKYDWDKLIAEIKTYGVRNSLLIGLMPTASTSQIMGNSECIEPYMSNIFIRSTLAGDFIIINKDLMKDLEELKLWDDDMRKLIIINNGSIQNIERIPEDIKKIYKTAFEISLKNIIQQSADRGAFVCQSQSLNLFIDKPNFDMLNSAIYTGWKLGLKTSMYYYRSVPAVNPISFGVDINDIKRLTNSKDAIDMLKNEYNETYEVDKSVNNNEIKREEPEECLVCGS